MSLEELGSTNTYAGEVNALEGGNLPNQTQVVKLELLVVIKDKREVTSFHSFTSCSKSKASFGLHIRCCNELRRIGEHRHMQEK